MPFLRVAAFLFRSGRIQSAPLFEHTPLGYIRIYLCITVFTFLAVSNAYSMPAIPNKVLTVVSPQGGNQKKAPSPLRFELREAENGLQVAIRFADTPDTKEKKANWRPDGPVGGDYLIFLDEMIVINEPYQGNTLDISRDVPLTTLRNGKHAIRCELRAPSGEVHKDEIKFIFDGSPAISLADPVVDKAGMLDPAVTINLLGDGFGFVDVFIDERPFINAQIKQEHTGKEIPLSQITGKPVPTAALVPGIHLLALRAMGMNGNATVSYSSFTVDTTPELKIIQDKNNDFQEAVATFPKSPEGYSGFVDVFYDQNLILSKRDEGASIAIKRAEIVEGLKKNNYEHRDVADQLVFALRAANGSENWQKIDFT